MLPGLGALSLGTPTGTKDDVVTEIRDEQREQALREAYRWEKRAATARKEVFDNEDLVKEVLLALDRGDDVYDTCRVVEHWCSLNKARRAACDDAFYLDLGKRIWGDIVHARWLGVGPHDRFRSMCQLEHEFRTGKKKLEDNAHLGNVKRIVLAAIAASSSSLENVYNLLSYASDELRDNEDVVRAAVAKDPREIQFASPRLQGLITPLRPTIYWPPKPAMEREFHRQWSGAVLHTLLYSDWTKLTVMKIMRKLGNEHPEFGLDYFRVTHREDLKRLVDLLMLHIKENMRLAQAR